MDGFMSHKEKKLVPKVDCEKTQYGYAKVAIAQQSGERYTDRLKKSSK